LSEIITGDSPSSNSIFKLISLDLSLSNTIMTKENFKSYPGQYVLEVRS